MLIRLTIWLSFMAVLSLSEETLTSPMMVTTIEPCGPYGFRCIEIRTYQVCSFGDMEGSTEKPDSIHECHDGYVCDEDNPAFCTPVDMSITVHHNYEIERNLPNNGIVEESDDEYYFDSYDDENENRELRDINKKSADDYITEPTQKVSSTSTTDRDITTSNPEVFASPQYDCEGYGFFPDNSNRSLFWFCDVPENGEGYFLRHMLCSNNRFFDPLRKECILSGTIRNARHRMGKILKDQKNLNRRQTMKFSCQGRSPGKYPDPTNCNAYFFCLPMKVTPVLQLTLLCPQGTTYDHAIKSCRNRVQYRDVSVQKNFKRNFKTLPQKKLKSTQPNPNELMNSFTCKSPIRFRDVHNCNGYFLCFNDEVLAMKCPQSYKFDDYLTECLPEEFARCQ